ncbi:Plasma membrane t-SNARE, secretory vesicle fusion [Thoreauomyces humboldtii]|nr:Plasma membrane t-SNARE, secretory vesicle fusion [Thoreauomyces humboldtii]
MSRDRTADLRATTNPRNNNNNNDGGYSQTPLQHEVYPTDNYSSRNNNDDVEMGRYPPQQQQSSGSYSQPASSRYNDNATQFQSQQGAYPPPQIQNSGSDMDAFFAQVEEAKSGIDLVRGNVNQIESLHHKALLGTSPDEQAHYTRQVDQLQDETSDLIQHLRATVKRLAAETKRAPKSDAGIRKQQQQGLAKRLVEVAQLYQKQQTQSKQKYRQRMEREIKIARPDARPEEIEQALDTNNNGSVFSQQLLSSRVGTQRAALAEVQTRHEEISRIERSITELFELFQEMQGLLEQQQETIDAIETHVDDTHIHIESGNKEMTQAIVHRKASRKKMWWIMLCCLILLIILALLVWKYLVPVFQKNNN